ncbi:MAG: arylsulfatase [Planctomycetota bacterium]
MHRSPARLLRALAIALAAAAGATSCSSPTKQPNVIVIFADDLGAGEVGAYGQARIRTPHIDSIARRGTRFTSAYSGSPVCAPSRCVLLTGKHTGHAAVRGNWENGGWGADEPEGQWPLPDEEVTLAERLGALGYRTAGYGKWGLGGPGTEGAPEKQGFDRFYGYLCQRKAHNYYPTHLWRNGKRVPIDGAEFFHAHQRLDAPLDDADAYYERFGGERAGYAPALIADDMIEWLDDASRSAEPFFLYYASIIPHLALQVPREDVERYPAEWDAEPYLGQNGYLPHPSPRRAYAGMISYLDDQVGRILATLEENGRLEDTIVIVTSDNGATYVGGVDVDFFGSHDGRRGRKGQLWEGGVRVPFAVQWPGTLAEGAVSDHVVSTVDLTATVLELVGAPDPARADLEGLDSVSFAEALRPDGAPRERPYLYWEYRPAGAQAVREGPWKLVRTGLKKGEPKLALFNLGTDPAETTDLAPDRPDVVERLAMLMDLSHEPSRGFPLPTIDGDAAEVMARRPTP